MLALILLLSLALATQPPEVTIKEKLLNKNSAPLIDLNEKELAHLLNTKADNWLVLFYDSQIRTANTLVNSWKRAAWVLNEDDYLVNLGKVDLRQNYTKSFMRLRLYNYPTAIYLEKGFFYNYTGPIDFYGVQDIVKNKTYLHYAKAKIPAPPNFMDLLKKTGRAILEGNFEVVKYLYILAGLLLVTLGFSCYRARKDMTEGKKLKED